MLTKAYYLFDQSMYGTNKKIMKYYSFNGLFSILIYFI